jgi:hypothetical protein
MRFEPLTKLKKQNGLESFKNALKKCSRAKLYYPLKTFDFEAYMGCIEQIRKELLPDFSINELGYLIYLYYWLEDKRNLAQPD